MLAKPAPSKVLDEAMQLEPTTRAFIAETLLESPDLDRDVSVSQEWLDEIRCRCTGIDGGKAPRLDDVTPINRSVTKDTK